MPTWPAVIPAITPLVLPGAAGPGTVATTGTTVTGTATTFIATFNVGDTIVSSAGDGRSIVSIASNTSMVITAAFSPDLPGGTTYTKGAVCNVPIEAVSEWQPIVEALCTYLGINPQGIYADVATRLAALAAAIAGSVTSVSGTAPVASSGGTTPAISMHVADGSHDGYLAQGDWSSFNSKLSSETDPLSLHLAGGTVTGLAIFTGAVNFSFGGSGSIGIGSTTYNVGSGSPNGSVTANVGSLYLNTSGGAGTTLYVKESGSGNVGWVAK